MKKIATFDLVLTAFFLGILILLASVPFLGFIPLGPINATTMHIPVIIASIILGPRIGGFLGGAFGIWSVQRGSSRRFLLCSRHLSQSMAWIMEVGKRSWLL